MDRLGYIENPLVQVAVAIYLRQPFQMMAPVVGYLFGKKGKQLDRYGENLAAASLPGYEWRILHSTFQKLVHDMMQLGHIFLEKEADNFLLNKVLETFAMECIEHIAYSYLPPPWHRALKMMSMASIAVGAAAHLVATSTYLLQQGRTCSTPTKCSESVVDLTNTQ